MVGLVLVACTSLLAACNTGNSSSSPKKIPNKPPSTAPDTVRTMRVDLQISGVHNITLKGAIGQCRFAAAGMAAKYVVADPQLGAGGKVTVFGPTVVPGFLTVPANVNALINGSGLLSSNQGTGVTVRPDLQSVALNTTITGPLVGIGGTIRGYGTDSITGTMRCI